MSLHPSCPPPPHHTWIQTEDGSWTVHSERFNESAHSTHGAVSETKLRFIEGCCLKKNFLDTGLTDFKIFEVGFGIGIGALESFALWHSLNSNVQVEFVSCEIDEKLILWCQKHLRTIFENQYSPETLELIGNLVLHPSKKYYESHYRQIFKLKILIGDIWEHQDFLKIHYKQQFNAIFQDAYSPKKNPTLWTLDWFLLLKKMSSPQAILSTYSSSISVRKNLIQAGFGIYNGPGFGKKKSSTMAYAHGCGDLKLHQSLTKQEIPL